MASEIGVGIGQGLARAGAGFSDALARVAQMRRQRDRMKYRRDQDLRERERYHEKIARDDTWRRIQAEQMPGVSVGERPEGGFTGALRNLGKIGDEPVYYGEPEPEPPTFTYRGADLPIGEEGFSVAQRLRRAVGGPEETGGGLKLRGARSPYDPVAQPEKYREWVRSVERPIQAARGGGKKAQTPSYSQAGNILERHFGTGERYDEETNAMRETFAIPREQLAAKQDSLVQGTLTGTDLSRRSLAGGGTPPPRTAADTSSGGTDFPGPKAGAEAAEPWDGPATLDHWAQAAGAALDAGADESKVRERLQARGLTPDQVDRVLNEAR